MDRTIIHNLVEQIVQEVVRRVEAELLRQQHPEQVAVLIGAKPTSAEKMEDWLQSRYGPAYTELSRDALTEQTALEAVGAAKQIVLASPTITQLQKIAGADSGDPICGAVIRALLWKKQVTVLLDYEPPKFRRNTFYETIADALETLKALGADVAYYEAFETQPEGTELVTESDVLAAAQTEGKTILCAYGAIITPAARDAIRETGVLLEYKGGSKCS